MAKYLVTRVQESFINGADLTDEGMADNSDSALIVADQLGDAEFSTVNLTVEVVE